MFLTRFPCLLTARFTNSPLQTCTAERLGQLNAESAACIAAWQVAVRHSSELGRFLVSGTGVPAGRTVLVLPPNRILRFEHVDDFNTVIQVRMVQTLALSLVPGCSDPQLHPGARQREPRRAAIQRQPDAGRPGQFPVALVRAPAVVTALISSGVDGNAFHLHFSGVSRCASCRWWSRS